MDSYDVASKICQARVQPRSIAHSNSLARSCIRILRRCDQDVLGPSAGLNMIPLIEAYRADPDDHLLLEVAMGALTGQMASIDDAGAGTCLALVATPLHQGGRTNAWRLLITPAEACADVFGHVTLSRQLL